MSKTFIYVLIILGVYFLVVATNKTVSGTGESLTEEEREKVNKGRPKEEKEKEETTTYKKDDYTFGGSDGDTIETTTYEQDEYTFGGSGTRRYTS
jgi:hypothetical protein